MAKELIPRSQLMI